MQRTDNVRKLCFQVFRNQPCADAATRFTADPGGHCGGMESIDALRYETGEDAREHVA